MRKKQGIFIKKGIAVLLAAAIAFGAIPQTIYASSSTKKEIDKKEDKKDKLQDQLGDKKDEISSLKGKQKTLQDELNDLNAQLTQVSERLADLEAQTDAKEQEIRDTQAALEQAKETEANQYEGMVQSVRLMYENNDTYILDVLFSAESFADFLNLADYYEKVNEYSLNLFAEYQANREFIQEEELKLQNEAADLAALKIEAEEEKASVSGLIEQASQKMSQYKSQIADAEKQALAYEAELKKVDQDLKVLKKKLEEEIAKSKAAANGTWRDVSSISYADGDEKLLASIIYCEAGNQSYAGKLAVGAVIINRVRSAVYPNSVVGVIYQKSQFSPASSGRLELALANNWASEDCYKAAREAMSGMTNIGSCVYFRPTSSGVSGTVIGGHVFY